MTAYPGNTWLMAEPTFPMLSRIILTSSDPGRLSLLDYFREVGHHPEYRAVERILKTDFGQVYLGSVDNPDSIQGAAVKGAWIDEAGLVRRLAYDVARQRCSMMNGQVLLTTTPYNLGWLKTEVWDKRDQPGYCVQRWRSIDRPGFPREAYERERQALPSWRFNMMFNALFEHPAGLIYDTFDEAVCLIPRFHLPDTWPRFSGHDFGGANPAALFTAQDPGTGFFYHYQEYLPGGGRSTHEHVEEFKKLTRGMNVLKRVGGSHQEEEIRQGYRAEGWPITEPKLERVEAQIDKVVGLHKLNKIYVFNDLEAYLDEKRSFSRKLDEQQRPTEEIEDKASFHLLSAERYLMSEFRPETVPSLGVSRVQNVRPSQTAGVASRVLSGRH